MHETRTDFAPDTLLEKAKVIQVGRIENSESKLNVSVREEASGTIDLCLTDITPLLEIVQMNEETRKRIAGVRKNIVTPRPNRENPRMQISRT